MAFTDWQPPDFALNKARAMCDLAIAKLAPVWLPANHDTMPGAFAALGITAIEDDVLDVLPAEFLGDINEPDYMEGLTESDKAKVRLVGDDTSRAKYAAELKAWNERTD